MLKDFEKESFDIVMLLLKYGIHNNISHMWDFIEKAQRKICQELVLKLAHLQLFCPADSSTAIIAVLPT